MIDWLLDWLKWLIDWLVVASKITHSVYCILVIVLTVLSILSFVYSFLPYRANKLGHYMVPTDCRVAKCCLSYSLQWEMRHYMCKTELLNYCRPSQYQPANRHANHQPCNYSRRNRQENCRIDRRLFFRLASEQHVQTKIHKIIYCFD